MYNLDYFTRYFIDMTETEYVDYAGFNLVGGDKVRKRCIQHDNCGELLMAIL